jgi:hypothetical protein
VNDTSRAHGHAIFDLLQPLTDLAGIERFFGKVSGPDSALTYPYLVVWANAGYRELLTMAGNLSDLTTVVQLTGVGRDVDEVLSVLDRSADLLEGVRPFIVGRTCGFIRNIPSGESVRPDETLRTPDGAPTYRGVALYELNSTAAPA